MKHLMIDLETMGVEMDAVICSIGAVEFDIETGATGRQFHASVDIQSCIDSGMSVSGSTIYWWLQQSPEARDKIVSSLNERVHIAVALANLKSFILQLDKDVKVWGNGATFDLSILESAYKKVYSTTPPWIHYNERDVRTLVDLMPDVKKNTPFTGLRHDPLCDCLHQITYCSEIWQCVRKGLDALIPAPLDDLASFIERHKEDVVFEEDLKNTIPSASLSPTTKRKA